ncbi:MAG TPA: ABC transporter permease [Roseiflexaceae bacterium]|nr:ABC transporter permease [Roseiflexaceae bacterium]
MDIIAQALREAIGLLLSGDPATMRVAGLSLAVSGAATGLAALVGVPLGAWLAIWRGWGLRVLVSLLNTGMALPPVVVGLFLALLFWRSGPLGGLDVMYTPLAMVIAQWIVAAPIAAGLTRAACLSVEPEIVEALRLDGASEWRVVRELVAIARAPVLVAIAAAFGRAIAEVGASLMVGGNILNQTRILTTAVALDVGRGEFARALALGLLLLFLALLVNSALGWPVARQRERGG